MTNFPQFVVALGDVSEELKRIPLAKVGTWFKGKQRFSITRADLAQIVANFRKRKTGDVVIDYDHSTEFAAGSGEPAPASGWLKSIEDGPDEQGVLYGEAEFTERASKMLAAREYKYISPVIVWGKRDKTTGEQQGATITSIALTNQPVLEEMPAITLSEAGWAEESEPEALAHKETEKMALKLILADRGARTARVIAEDGTETVLAVEGLEPQAKVIRLSEVKRTADGRLDFVTIAEGDEVLIASEVVRAMNAQSELDAAVAKGLITPAQRPHFEKLALSDLTGFRELVKTMKPQIELGERGIGGGAEEGDELKKIEAQIDHDVREKIKAEPKLQYHEGLKLVASEHPELDRRRTQLIRAKASKGDE